MRRVLEPLENRVLLASITGTVWQDRNGDGVQDAIEPGISGRTVYLDANDNAVLDAGETRVTSAADGSYSFTSLPAANYVVRQVVPTDWVSSAPASPDEARRITLAAGETKSGILFGSVVELLNPNPRITASDGRADDAFGESRAATDGGTLVVSSIFVDGQTGPDFGAAYVYDRDASGQWTQVAKLTASDGASFDYFGSDVAISGDRIVIGARNQSNIRGASAGAAYIFERNASGAWVQTAKLLASDGAANDYFGSSVAISGDSIAIGAGWADASGTNSGAVYIFDRDSGGVWTQSKKLSASGFPSTAYMGYTSLAFQGNTLAVGADVNDSGGAGSVFVFDRAAGNAWTQTTRLIPTGSSSNDWFSYKGLELDGDTIAVSAPFRNASAGSVFTFRRNAQGVWNQSALILPTDGSTYGLFGRDIALQGEALLIGSTYATTQFGSEAGAAYLFRRSGPDTWNQVKRLEPSSGSAGDHFGSSVAMDSASLIVAASGSDARGNNSGAFYTWSRIRTGYIQGTVWNDRDADGVQDANESGLSGRTVYLDANDNGVFDPGEQSVISNVSGDYEFQNLVPGNYVVRQVVLAGWRSDWPSASGQGLQITVSAGQTVTGVSFGQVKSVVIQQQTLFASDPVQSDGFGSTAISGDYAAVGTSTRGGVYLYKRSSAGTWSQIGKLTNPDNDATDAFGEYIAMSGDTLIVSSRGDDDRGNNSGAAYLYHLSSGNWTFDRKLTASDGAAGDQFGLGVAISGDTIAIGAYGKTVSASEQGAVYVFRRDVNGVWTQRATLLANDASAGDFLSYPAAVAVDGDEIIVGAQSKAPNGTAYVFRRVTGDTYTQEAILTNPEPTQYKNYGAAVAIHGDFAVVGAPFDNRYGSDPGSAYLFRRNDDGSWSFVQKLASTNSDDTGFGASLAMTADTLWVGALSAIGPNNTSPNTLTGAAYQFRQDGVGHYSLLRRATSNNAAPFDRFGAFVSADGQTAIIAATNADTAATNAGAAYVFDEPLPGYITGVVYQDLDADGMHDAGEPALTNWTVYLDSNDNGVLDAGETSTTTDQQGNYAFNDLAPGSYVVREQPLLPLFQSKPSNGQPYRLNLLAGQTAISDFAFTGLVTGRIFADNNHNSQYDSGDVVLPSWVVFVDYNNNGILDANEPSTTTAIDGTYTIPGLADGTYRVTTLNPAASQALSTQVTILNCAANGPANIVVLGAGQGVPLQYGDVQDLTQGYTDNNNALFGIAISPTLGKGVASWTPNFGGDQQQLLQPDGSLAPRNANYFAKLPGVAQPYSTDGTAGFQSQKGQRNTFVEVIRDGYPVDGPNTYKFYDGLDDYFVSGLAENERAAVLGLSGGLLKLSVSNPFSSAWIDEFTAGTGWAQESTLLPGSDGSGGQILSIAADGSVSFVYGTAGGLRYVTPTGTTVNLDIDTRWNRFVDAVRMPNGSFAVLTTSASPTEGQPIAYLSIFSSSTGQTIGHNIPAGATAYSASLYAQWYNARIAADASGNLFVAYGLQKATDGTVEVRGTFFDPSGDQLKTEQVFQSFVQPGGRFNSIGPVGGTPIRIVDVAGGTTGNFLLAWTRDPSVQGTTITEIFLQRLTESLTPTGSIGTSLFADTNGNGIHEAGEIGLANVTVSLYKSDGDGTFEPNTDDTFVASLISDANGAVNFSSLPAGDYWVSYDNSAASLAGHFADNTLTYARVAIAANSATAESDFTFDSHITVSESIDEQDGNYTNGHLSLREAVFLASQRTGISRIAFDPSLAGQTLTLSPARGQFSITGNLEIDAPSGGITLSAGNASRVFLVQSNASLTLNGLTLTNGQTSTGGLVYIDDDGQLTLENASLKSGTASSRGGAVFVSSDATLDMDRSTIAQSTASFGGGIFADFDSTVLITASTISNCQATTTGGAVLSDGTFTLLDSTISTNTSNGNGGGLFLDFGNATIVNSTIAYNTADADRNNSGVGGGIDVANATVTLNNSILAGNLHKDQPDDVQGALASSSSNNLISTGAAGLNGANIVGSPTSPVDAGLYPLANYGGPTQTHALRSTSPAIDQGSNALATSAGLTTDQIGAPRVRGSAVDIGAVESSAVIVVDSLHDETTDSDGKTSLREALAQASANPGLDTIQFSSSLVSSGQIVIPATLGQWVIDSVVDLQGRGDASVILDGLGAARVLQIASTASVLISDLTIRNGNASDGAGINNAGQLQLQGVLLSGNNSAGNGGAIANSGSLTLLNTTITQNAAAGDGGGIFQSGGTLNTTNVSIYANRSNSDDIASGVGGGIAISAGTATLGNAIVAGNWSGTSAAQPDDVHGAFVASSSFNFIGSITGSTGLNGAGTLSGVSAAPIDPKLNPLADNGGPTQTISVQAGAPVTDAGSNALATAAGLTVDQRNLPRVKDGDADTVDRVDIGAFEQQFPLNQAPILTTISTLGGAAEASPFTIRYDLLKDSSDAVDPEGQPVYFRLVSLNQGTLLDQNGLPVVPGQTLLGDGQQWTWTPPAINFGSSSDVTLPAFTVVANDGLVNSLSPVQVNIKVTSAAQPVNYVVLFSGGDNIDINYPIYYANLKRLYQTLTTQYAVLPQNIYVISADGRDPAPDEVGGVNSDMSFAQNVLPATRDNLRNTLISLSQVADSNDHLLFWCFDHGLGTTDDPSVNGEEVIRGWGPDETIHGDELSVWLQGLKSGQSAADYDVPAGYQGIRAQYSTYVFAECFAGGMLDNLTLDANHFGMASSNHYEASYADYFASAFNDALDAGQSTTTSAFQYTIDHDARAAQGQPNNGGDWTYGVEHPWADGGQFPVFAPATINGSTAPTIASVAPLHYDTSQTKLTVTFDMLRAAVDATDPMSSNGKPTKFQISNLFSGQINVNGTWVSTLAAPITITYGGSFDWKPQTSVGVGAFDLKVVGSGGSSATWPAVQINFGSPVPGPAAVNDSAVVWNQSVNWTLNPLQNDVGTSLQVKRVGVALHGQVTLDSTGHVLYTPSQGYVGTDQFSYVVIDGNGVTDMATFNLTVTSYDPTTVPTSSIKYDATELAPPANWAGLPEDPTAWPWSYRSGLNPWTDSQAIDISENGTVLVDVSRAAGDEGDNSPVGSTNTSYIWDASTDSPYWNTVPGPINTASVNTDTLALLRDTKVVVDQPSGRTGYDGVEAIHIGNPSVFPAVDYDSTNAHEIGSPENLDGFDGTGGIWYDIGTNQSLWQPLPADIFPVDVSTQTTNSSPSYYAAVNNLATEGAELWSVGRDGASKKSAVPGLGGSQESYTYDMNSAGHMVGWVDYQSSGGANDVRGFLYDGTTSTPKMTPLGLLSGKPESVALSVNDSDVAVGFASSDHVLIDLSSAVAVEFNGTSVTSLGTLGGSGWSVANDINNTGIVVGTSNNTAVIWINGQIYDLNTMIGSGLPPGLVLTAANAINDAGQIAVTGTYMVNSNPHTLGFLLNAQNLVTCVDDSISTSNQSPVTFNVLDNDSKNLTLSSVSSSNLAGLKVDLSVSGQMTYDPRVSFAPNQQGTITFTYTAKDAQNHTKTATVTINVINYVPNAPQLVAGSDHGVSQTDGITNLNNSSGAQLSFLVTNTHPGETVKIKAGTVVIGQAVAQPNTTSTTVTTDGTSVLGDGVYIITAVQSDQSGAYPASASTVITIDTHAPTVQSSTFEYLTRNDILLNLSENPVGTLTESDVSLMNLTTGQPVNLPAGSISVGLDNTATISFPGFSWGALPDGNYVMTLPAGSFTDAAGNALASSNSLSFYVLAGDVNRDRTVDKSDLSILAQNWLGHGKTWQQADLNHDGVVDVADLGIIAKNFMKTLAPPSPPPQAPALTDVMDVPVQPPAPSPFAPVEQPEQTDSQPDLQPAADDSTQQNVEIAPIDPPAALSSGLVNSTPAASTDTTIAPVIPSVVDSAAIQDGESEPVESPVTQPPVQADSALATQAIAAADPVVSVQPAKIVASTPLPAAPKVFKAIQPLTINEPKIVKAVLPVKKQIKAPAPKHSKKHAAKQVKVVSPPPPARKVIRAGGVFSSVRIRAGVEI